MYSNNQQNYYLLDAQLLADQYVLSPKIGMLEKHLAFYREHNIYMLHKRSPHPQ